VRPDNAFQGRIGVGVGVAIVPFNMIILTTVPGEYAGVTAGVLQTALTIGGALELGVLLIPLDPGNGGLAANISTVFEWILEITVLALLGPDRRIRPRAGGCGDAGLTGSQ
jgi:hypothetical protein